MLNEAKSRFQQIMEYTTRRNKYTEEADDQPQDPETGGAPMDGADPMAGGAPADPNGGMPAPGGDMSPQGDDMGADPAAGAGWWSCLRRRGRQRRRSPRSGH